MCLTDCAIFYRIGAVASFALCLPQLTFGRIDFALRLLAKKNPTELISLIVSGDEFFLRVRSIKIHARRLQRKVAHEIHPQIEHLRPKIGDLLVTDALLAGQITSCDHTSLPAVFPMCLTPPASYIPLSIHAAS